MTNILVTGANGLIGQALLPVLSKQYKVYAVSRTKLSFYNENVRELIIDLNEQSFVNHLPNDIDCIIHLAQSEKFRDFPSNSIEVFNVNTISTLKLLDYANKNGIKKFIYASSGGIYGNGTEGFNEDFPITSRKDLGFYLGSKLCSEIVAENYSPFFDVILLRFFFVYGKHQKAGMLVPRLIESVKSTREISLDGNEGIKINPIYVEDAANAIKAAIDIKGSHKINIGGPQILSLREMVETIGEKLGQSPKFIINQKEAKNLIGDIKKMSKLLVTPKIEFKEGINKLIE